MGLSRNMAAPFLFTAGSGKAPPSLLNYLWLLALKMSPRNKNS